MALTIDETFSRNPQFNVITVDFYLIKKYAPLASYAEEKRRLLRITTLLKLLADPGFCEANRAFISWVPVSVRTLKEYRKQALIRARAVWKIQRSLQLA